MFRSPKCRYYQDILCPRMSITITITTHLTATCFSLSVLVYKLINHFQQLWGKVALLTLRGHSDDGLRSGVIFVLLHKLILKGRVSLEIVMVQKLLEWGCLGEQLVHYLPTNVRSLLEPQLAKDLRLDGLQPQDFTLLSPNACGTSMSARFFIEERKPVVRGSLARWWQKKIRLVTPRQSQTNINHQTQQKVIPRHDDDLSGYITFCSRYPFLYPVKCCLSQPVSLPCKGTNDMQLLK